MSVCFFLRATCLGPRRFLGVDGDGPGRPIRAANIENQVVLRLENQPATFDNDKCARCIAIGVERSRRAVTEKVLYYFVKNEIELCLLGPLLAFRSHEIRNFPFHTL